MLLSRSSMIAIGKRSRYDLPSSPSFTTQPICLARQAEPSTLSLLPKELLVHCLLCPSRPVRGS